MATRVRTGMEMPTDRGLVELRVDAATGMSAGEFTGLVTAFGKVLENYLNSTQPLEDQDWVAIIDSVDSGSYLVRFMAAAKREWEGFREAAAEMAGFVNLPENRLVRWASYAAIGEFMINLAQAMASVLSNEPPPDSTVNAMCEIVIESGATITVSGSGCPPVTISSSDLKKAPAFDAIPLPDAVRMVLEHSDIYVSDEAALGRHRDMTALAFFGAGRTVRVIDEAGRQFDAVEMWTSKSIQDQMLGNASQRFKLVVQPVYDQGRIACLFVRRAYPMPR
ncbi:MULTISPECIES: hypothetical protein [Sphingomonadales]|uniref:hypothetical protein n=1 Tax=Sphingomonadales TaxID=204457 RepID=UPI0008322B4C|nr:MULTISPECIES: hypothetical protein [Sphingomonadales]